MEVLHDPDGLLPELLVLEYRGVAVERVHALVDADIAEGYRGPSVLENGRNGIISLEPYAAGACHVEDRGNPGAHAVEALDAADQGLLADCEAAVEDLVELLLVMVGLNRDAREVEAHDAEVVAAVDLLHSVSVQPLREEAPAAHRVLEGSGDADNLLVVEDVRVHALGGALQRELLDIVVGIALLVVDTVLNREDELREHRGPVVLPEAAHAVLQDGLLDESRRP